MDARGGEVNCFVLYLSSLTLKLDWLIHSIWELLAELFKILVSDLHRRYCLHAASWARTYLLQHATNKKDNELRKVTQNRRFLRIERLNCVTPCVFDHPSVCRRADKKYDNPDLPSSLRFSPWSSPCRRSSRTHLWWFSASKSSIPSHFHQSCRPERRRHQLVTRKYREE